MTVSWGASSPPSYLRTLTILCFPFIALLHQYVRLYHKPSSRFHASSTYPSLPSVCFGLLVMELFLFAAIICPMPFAMKKKSVCIEINRIQTKLFRGFVKLMDFLPLTLR